MDRGSRFGDRARGRDFRCVRETQEEENATRAYGGNSDDNRPRAAAKGQPSLPLLLPNEVAAAVAYRLAPTKRCDRSADR